MLVMFWSATSSGSVLWRGEMPCMDWEDRVDVFCLLVWVEAVRSNAGLVLSVDCSVFFAWCWVRPEYRNL